jgi:hypothetical protein
MKKKTILKAVSNVVVIGILFTPFTLILAQTIAAGNDSGANIATSTSNGNNLSNGPIQDTSNTQITIPSDALETTLNPNLDIGTTTVPVEVATSTPSAPDAPPADTSTSTEVTLPDPTPEPVPVIETEPVVDPTAPVDIVAIDASALVPKSEYSFKIGTNKIVAKKKVAKGASVAQAQNNTPAPDLVTADLNTSVDSATGALSFSGACASKYYVVLLYKNADDYDVNPRRYILNKAFKCENNSYSYSISSLPDSLTNGTYYLMVAEQGDEGGWTPITTLTPIDINRNE